MGAAPQEVVGADGPSRALAVADLTFSYRGISQPVFDGLNHRFEVGAMTVVTGPSGVGKSTLLYLLGLLLTPRSGHVELGGVVASDLADADRSRLRARSLGFVFQDAALDPGRTVLDNVLEGARYADLPDEVARPRALQLLSSLGVELRATHRPGEISGGQAQRVGLCRALVKEPAVLLADEPTGNLDAASAGVVLDTLHTATHDDVTVVVASHDAQVVARADAVLELA